MPYTARIPDWFSVRTAAQVTAFFASKAGGRINVLRACKLIYLSDRASMERRDHPITGDDFVSMPFGPVNTYTLSLMNGEVEQKHTHVWAEFIAPRAGNDIPLASAAAAEAFDQLSRSDIRILDSVWNDFKDIDRFDLAEWTLKFCPEWQDPNGSAIPIPFATVYKTLNKQEPVELSDLTRAERALVVSLKVGNA